MDSLVRVHGAGHDGLGGSAIARLSARRGYASVLECQTGTIDLQDQAATDAFFQKERSHLMISANVIDAALHLPNEWYLERLT